MSSSFSASQFNSSYSPKALGNWEVPATGRDRSPKANHPAARGPTQFVVNDNGHLLDTVKNKKMTAFTTGFEDLAPPARWPDKHPRSGDTYGGASTMGYKGIETSYLPSSTVFLQTKPGSPERKYS